MNKYEIENECRTPGTDVGNLGDNSTMTVKTADGKEIKLRLYGR
jgi:endonuclease YncB( thermonuclease family)